MTHNAEMFLLKEMDKDDFMEFQDFSSFKNTMDTFLGIDVNTGDIVDEDAGMIFPQPLKEFEVY